MNQAASRIGRIAVSLAAGAAASIGALAAHAQQNYPAQPVRLIVPFPPGGQTDNVSRVLSAKIPSALGQQLVIDNRGGASGTIGAGEVARAKPDGYTILIATSSTHAINPLAMPNVAYDAVKDFAPITVIGTGPIAVSVHPIVPVKTIKQLIAAAKAKPGYYSYASSGVASINNLAGELFKTKAGKLNILHVPFRGAGPSLIALVGGQLEMACTTLSAALPHHRGGRVRTLAIMKEERSISAPDIPTVIESGVPDVVAYTFNILLAPAGTPRPVVDHLQGAVAKVMADRSFVEALVKLGVDPVTKSDPEHAAGMIKTELAKWKPLITALGLGSDGPTRAAAQRK
jgi:tripartite-type tricarboxylate transporter receptor subunit TctC